MSVERGFIQRVRPLPTFQSGARQALGNSQLRRNLYKATHTIRAKREQVVGEMPDWQELREAGRAIKDRVMRHLDTYLLQLEAAVQQAGGHVHWARDASEANAIVTQIVAEHGAREVIKVKSLTTDEIKLNAALAARGIEAFETDLGGDLFVAQPGEGVQDDRGTLAEERGLSARAAERGEERVAALNRDLHRTLRGPAS